MADINRLRTTLWSKAEWDLLASDWQPPAADLAEAPLLDHWQRETGEFLRLQGFVEGHPIQPDGPVVTSAVVSIDRRLMWVKTKSRLYRLGRYWNERPQ